MQRKYLCIDLKSFYASVECVDRGLDPLDTNLVVADETRTEKTICLAVTPSLKAYGISGRPRLFEVVQAVERINAKRRSEAKYLKDKSVYASELAQKPELELDYITAPPRMARYIECSQKIYEIYLKYVSNEDILVYSIDEVFMDITNYLGVYKGSAKMFAVDIIKDVLAETGITATAGIGTNMYLAKIAMDITAKKMKADKNGVRIAELDEMSYRRELWEHRSLTDFWRVGRGYSKKLEDNNMFTMGDIARTSLDSYGRKKLKKLFGINAKMLIDHAWGYEPCTMAEAKAYTPENKSISTGQVLQCAYKADDARVVVWEMTEFLALDLVEKHIVTNQVVLTVGYEAVRTSGINEIGSDIAVKTDMYGRKIPKHAHGTINLNDYTASAKVMTEAVLNLYDKIVNKKIKVRRINIAACGLKSETLAQKVRNYEQIDLFTDYAELDRKRKTEELELKKERKLQETMIDIKNKYGKNAVIKATSLREEATGTERNQQIGGHKA